MGRSDTKAEAAFRRTPFPASHPTADAAQVLRGDRAVARRRALRTGLDVARLLAQRHLCHCILHGWQSGPAYPSSDVDLAITPGDLRRLEETLRHCDGARLVQLLRHEASSYYFVLAASHDGDVRYLTLDAALDYRVAGSLFFSGEELLGDRRQEDGFWVAAPATEFGYLLVKKICKKRLPDAQKRRLHALSKALGEDAYTMARRLLGARWGTWVVSSIAQATWTTLEASLPRLKRALWWQAITRRPLTLISYWLPELWRRWQRWRYPTGLCVAVLGSDGSGKSTLVERLRDELAGAFRRTAVFHLRPPLRRREGAVKPVTDPHGKAPHPRWLSCLKIAHSVVAYALGYLLSVRPRLAASTLVLFDRYYDDLLVDPRRYRYGGPLALARFARRMVHRPDLFLVIDVGDEALLRRKREVPREELRRQRVAYRRLAAEYPNAVLLNGALPAGDLARQARDIIIDCLYRRYMQRRSLWFADDDAETFGWLTATLGAPSAQARRTPSWRTWNDSEPAGQRRDTFVWLPFMNGRGYLIPLASRRAAVRALELYNAQSLKARVARGLLAASLRTGFGGYVLRRVERVVEDGQAIGGGARTDFVEYLRELLGGEDLSVAISLGTRGPHRKPVLMALSGAGDALAYVKVGSNELTNALVRHEAEILGLLAGRSFQSFMVPAVLHAGWWNGRYVCVQSCPPEAGKQPAGEALTSPYVRITRELAAVHTEWRRLKDSEFWRRLHAQIDTVSHTCYRDPLQRGVRRAEGWFEGKSLPWHFSHGDFAPWNMKLLREKIFVFDWEHASQSAPPAWDLFHFMFEAMRVQRRTPREIIGWFFRDPVVCAAADEAFDGLGLGRARERFLYLYLLTRLASWCVQLPEHAAGFTEVQALVHSLQILEPMA